MVVVQLLHWQHCDYKRGESTEGDSGNDPGAGAEADPIHAKFSQPRYPSLPVAKKRLCFYKCKYKHKYTTEITEAVSPGPGGQGLHLCGTHQVRRVQRRRGRTLPKAIWTQASTALAALWFGQVWFGVVGLLW